MSTRKSAGAAVQETTLTSLPFLLLGSLIGCKIAILLV